MKKIIAFFKRLFFGDAPKKKKRRPRVEPLWPTIIDRVEAWEKCVKDDRVTWQTVSMLKKRNASKVIKECYQSMPPWGAYACSKNAEVLKSMCDRPRIDTRVHPPGSTHLCFSGDKWECGDDDNWLLNGITLVVCRRCDSLWPGVYAFDEGILYECCLAHWSSNEGHDLLEFQFIVTPQGEIKPAWCQSRVRNSVKSKRGWVSIPSSSWRQFVIHENSLSLIAASFAFYQERDMHWNCVVSSEGVPPLGFPVVEQDLVRVFPRGQRDGDGRLVHWVKAHKRKTKRGETYVRTHIRANTRWVIDGRQVAITMPGKHHGELTDITEISSDDAGGVKVKDPVTGIEYITCRPSMMQRLLRRAEIKKDDIEIAA